MNSYEKIQAAAQAVNIPAYPDDFTRSDTKYITYNFIGEVGANFGDDAPENVVATLQLHLFLPRDENFFELRQNLRYELFSRGFTYPEITYNGIETGTDTRHIVFEFEDDEDDF